MYNKAKNNKNDAMTAKIQCTYLFTIYYLFDMTMKE